MGTNPVRADMLASEGEERTVRMYPLILARDGVDDMNRTMPTRNRLSLADTFIATICRAEFDVLATILLKDNPSHCVCSCVRVIV